MSNSIFARFAELHRAGCFVMPNPWDAGSAIFLTQLGFPALATTSAGLAFARGLPDGQWALPRDVTLANLREIVAATPLPVNADFEAGYAHEPAELAENVARCVATGVAGLSIEDNRGDAAAPLYPLALAVERIAAARAAIDKSGVPVLLTARCEAYLVGVAEPARVARERLSAYAAAGADCLFAPGVRDPGEIAALVRAVAPRPLNVVMSAPGPGLSLPELAELGVRRISLGVALARAAWGGFARAARALAAGSFEPLADGVPFAELNQLFAPRK